MRLDADKGDAQRRLWGLGPNTLRSLELRFTRHDLEGFEVGVVRVYDGSPEVCDFGFPDAYPIGNKRKRRCADEKARGYNKFKTYVGFAENVRYLRALLFDLLSAWRYEWMAGSRAIRKAGGLFPSQADWVIPML